MTKVWLIWLQAEEGAPWLEAAMDDEMTAESGKWEPEVERVRALAATNEWEMRIQAVNVPGVYDLFEIPTVTASPAEEMPHLDFTKGIVTMVDSGVPPKSQGTA